MCRAANTNRKVVVQAGHFEEKWALQKLASALNRSQIMPTASAGSATISGIFDSIRYTQKGSKN
jgi:hypothetical protein